MNFLPQAPITKGTRVFVRCDIDVTLEKGIIMEPYRLGSIIPTLTYIVEKGGIPVIAGHMGKPKGKPDPELSTTKLKSYFTKALGGSDFVILENLRFDPREEAYEKSGDDAYARELASKADLYVNESFATSHRNHASITGVPKFLPSYAGLRFAKEIEILSNLLKNPNRPFTVIIGGAKLESKMPVVTKFLEVADTVLLGGLLGLEWKGDIPSNLRIPSDYTGENKDIGPQTIATYIEIIQHSKTVLWAGPMGMYEQKEYIQGTFAISNELTYLTKADGFYSVVGGGDTITAIKKCCDINDYSFVSTGGGAMLQYLAYGTLPGIEALNNQLSEAEQSSV